MGKTLGTFFRFVVGDPIMLGLCIAIVVLTILFIIVLIWGRIADKKEAELMKKYGESYETQIDLSRMQDEPKEVAKFEVPESTMEVPVETSTPEKVEFEGPIFDREPKPVIGEEPVVPLIDTPVQNKYSSFDDLKIVAPEPSISEEKKAGSDEVFAPLFENPVFDKTLEEDESKLWAGLLEDDVIPRASFPKFDAFDETITSPEPTSTASVPPIVESSVMPVENSDTSAVVPSVNEQLIDDYTLEGIDLSPTDVNFNVKTPERAIEQPANTETLENMYSLDNDELPEIKVDDFSRTSLIRHIPVMDIKTNYVEDEESDDLDLPKLSSDASNQTAFKSLQGESFNMPKNS